MGWASVAGSVASAAIGGFGGSKAGERSARDAAALEQVNIQAQQRIAQKNSQPYVDAGIAAQDLLGDYLGTGTPDGYASRPTYQDAYDKVWARIYSAAGGKGFRKTNVSAIHREADLRYKENLQAWEDGLKNLQANNPDANSGSPVHGRLLREFSNEDFVKDPGYNFRLDEGSKGLDRALAARGGTESGAALKAISRYNQEFGSNEFQQAFNRDAVNKNSIYSFLSGEAGKGLAAAQGNAGLALSAAQTNAQISGNLTNTLLNQQNQRNANQQNALQAGIRNAVYSFEKNSPVINNGNSSPGYTGGSSSAPSTGTPWYLS